MTKTPHRKPRPAPKTNVPVVQHLLKLIDESGLLIEEIVKPSGVSAMTIRNWRRGAYGVQLNNFRAVANLLGYEVVLIKKDLTK